MADVRGPAVKRPTSGLEEPPLRLRCSNKRRAAFGRGGVRRLELKIENRCCGPHTVRSAAVVMIGHAAACRRDVRPSGTDGWLGCADPMRPGKDGCAATRPGEEAMEAGPSQSWTTKPESKE